MPINGRRLLGSIKPVKSFPPLAFIEITFNYYVTMVIMGLSINRYWYIKGSSIELQHSTFATMSSNFVLLLVALCVTVCLAVEKRRDDKV